MKQCQRREMVATCLQILNTLPIIMARRIGKSIGSLDCVTVVFVMMFVHQCKL